MKPLLILLLALALTACTQPTVTPAPSATLPPPTRTSTPTVTPSPVLPAATITPSPAPSQAPTDTITPSPATTFDVKLIREPTSDGGGSLITAFWSEDGNQIIYGLENWVYTDTYTSTWFSIDIGTGQTVELPSAPPITYTPVIDGFTYPDYGGFVSPSGRYRLHIDSNLDEVGWFSSTPVVSTLSLIDTTGDEPPYQLIYTGDLFYRKAFWTRDESRVVFGVGPEFGTEIYVLDIPTLTLTPLSELIGFSYNPDLPDWALSPDGNAIALSDFDLQVVSLDGQLYADLPAYFNRYRTYAKVKFD